MTDGHIEDLQEAGVIRKEDCVICLQLFTAAESVTVRKNGINSLIQVSEIMAMTISKIIFLMLPDLIQFLCMRVAGKSTQILAG